SGTTTGTYGFSLLADAHAYDAFSIAIGDSVSNGVPGPGAGNIETPGSIDSYSFTGTAGQIVRIAGPSLCCDPYWQVLAPDGSTVTASWWFGNANSQQLLLPLTGTYTIQVVGFAATGAYSFSLLTDPHAYETFKIAVGDSVS